MEGGKGMMDLPSRCMANKDSASLDFALRVGWREESA